MSYCIKRSNIVGFELGTGKELNLYLDNYNPNYYVLKDTNPNFDKIISNLKKDKTYEISYNFIESKPSGNWIFNRYNYYYELLDVKPLEFEGTLFKSSPYFLFEEYTFLGAKTKYGDRYHKETEFRVTCGSNLEFNICQKYKFEYNIVRGNKYIEKIL